MGLASLEMDEEAGEAQGLITKGSAEQQRLRDALAPHACSFVLFP